MAVGEAPGPVLSEAEKVLISQLTAAVKDLVGGGFVTWRQALITGVSFLAAMTAILIGMQDSHNKQPHQGAVTREELSGNMYDMLTRLASIEEHLRDARRE